MCGKGGGGGGGGWGAKGCYSLLLRNARCYGQFVDLADFGAHAGRVPDLDINTHRDRASDSSTESFRTACIHETFIDFWIFSRPINDGSIHFSTPQKKE